jgi:hypothetical protein
MVQLSSSSLCLSLCLLIYCFSVVCLLQAFLCFTLLLNVLLLLSYSLLGSAIVYSLSTVACDFH